MAHGIMCIRLGSGKTLLCINNMKQDPLVRKAAKSVRATGSGPAGSWGFKWDPPGCSFWLYLLVLGCVWLHST